MRKQVDSLLNKSYAERIAAIYEEKLRVILAITADKSAIRSIYPILVFNIPCSPTTEKINPKLKTKTTTGSTRRPGLSSV